MEMSFQFTWFNVATLVLIGLTAWVISARLRGRLESNWPLLYYALVVVYWQVFPGGLNSYWIFAGVVSAALLRFEFLGGVILTFVRVVEFCFFGYIFWRALTLLLLWPW
jgi:hypothetical protein